MSNIVFNVALGRVRAYYDRVKEGDPSTARLTLVPIETSGLESDATLIDSDTLAAVLSGATNEQTTMGRKTLAAADLAASAQDDTNDRVDLSLPTVTWSAATGNAISKVVVCYNPNSSADSAIVPLTLFDFVATPDGTDLQMTTGVFYRAD